MARRLAALVLLAALALAGSVAYGLTSAGQESCRMGKACPMSSVHRATHCPTRAIWNVELGCCAPTPAAPPAPAPTVACPYSGGADVVPAVLTSGTACPPAVRPSDASRERSRAARLHDLGLFTLHSVLLI